MAEQIETYWTAGFLNERFPAPVSPLGWSVVGEQFDEYALREPLRYMGYRDADRIPTTRLVHGHPYVNVLIFEIFYKPFPERFVPADAVRYFPEGDTNRRKKAPYPSGMLDPKLIGALLAHFVRDPLNWSPLNAQVWDSYTRRHDQRVAALNAQLAEAGSPAEILAVAEGARGANADLLKIHRWSLTYADIFYQWLAGMSGAAAQSLISDQNNITRQMNAELAELGGLARRMGLALDSAEGIAAAQGNPEFGRALEGFLRVHGHRSFSLDIARPTFADDPAQALRMLHTAPETSRNAEDWRLTRERVRNGLPLWEKPVFELVLGFARRYALLRENQRYYWHKSLAVSRRAYLRLADYLCADQVIDARDYVFYATQGELADYFGGRLTAERLATLIRERREAWDRYGDEYRRAPARAYPAFLKGDTPIEREQEPVRESWRGRGVSPGQGEGAVHVILDASELNRVQAGEVLVAPATDPGWTPVFARLSGLVLERGGILAHGAIVAREHHLPAVAGIPHITQELQDGDWVAVDGTEGTVRRIRSQATGHR
ncbi:MAG: PEP-utilizing enzyme [Anaerolineae bacterium]